MREQRRRAVAYAAVLTGGSGGSGDGPSGRDGIAALLGGLMLLGMGLLSYGGPDKRRRIAMLALLMVVLSVGASAGGGEETDHGSTQAVTAIENASATAVPYSGLPASLGTVSQK